LLGLEVEVDRNAAESDDTVEVVVLAANRVSSTSSASKTDASDGVTSHTDGGGDVLDEDVDDAEQTQGSGAEIRTVFDSVAALNGASGAFSSGDATVSSTTLSGTGSGESNEGGGDEESDFGEHGD
jgi:hypothetical protein